MSDPTASPEILARIRSIPQLAHFPELDQFIENYPVGMNDFVAMSYRMLVAEDQREDISALEAAVYAATLGSFLIDDVMDCDTTKPDFGMDVGRRVNLGCTLLVAGSLMIAQSGYPAGILTQLQEEYAQWLLHAAVGQEIEARSAAHGEATADLEARYWEAVGAKSSQQVGCMLRFGAVMAGRPDQAEGLFRIGRILGEMAQILDDIGDGVGPQRSPDWESPGKNLLMVFCHHPSNPQREEFVELFPKTVSDAAAHRRCREIMISSGAVGYAIYQYFDRYRQARALAEAIEGYDRRPLKELVSQQIKKIAKILHRMGIRLPEDIAREAGL
ncbi:MAG: polyprenyl synthetase family protein [Akkermansiaceae bacterium]|jgi:geranylgeranyl pyrophosphate synthase|nr:polyprenyl synthetase family protein [Akkermansiaceae bacterium]